MAIKDGRCPNCGSIAHLDSNSEKGHCLFCDAVFDTAQAIEIAQNPDGVEFPNEPQPQYDGPSLQPGRSGGGSGSRAVSKKKKPAKKVTPQKPKEYVMKEPVKLPDFKVPAPVKRKIVLILLAIVVVLAAILAPLIISRDNVRGQLLDSMQDVTPFAIDVESAVAITRFSNSYLVVASGETISQDDAAQLFIGFCQKRAELIGLDAAEANAYSKVTLKLVTPDGGWLISEPMDRAAVESGEAITALIE